MRIGMMADAYKPHISGITNYISLNKHFLEQQGHEVFIFTYGDADYQDDETNVIRSPGLPLTDTGFYFGLNYNSKARKLLYTMDIVHIHHPFLSGSLARRYCRPRGIPLVFTNHTRYDLYAQVYLPIVGDAVGETMLQAYMPSFCRACDMVIAPSKGMQQILRRLGVDVPIEIVPNGVDLAPFCDVAQPVERTSLGILLKDVVLIYVGRLGPEKNLPFLLRAFAGIAEAFDQVKLVLVGDGPERENLQDQASHMAGGGNKVIFTGMVPYQDLPRYLAMADGFVTASVTEVHPLSIIEAMAAGMPVLGIDSPGVGDTVQDGVTGLLSSDDLAVFTAKMAKLVLDGEQRRAMGIWARKAAQNYAIERTVEIMASHYERLIQQAEGSQNRWQVRLYRFFDNWRA